MKLCCKSAFIALLLLVGWTSFAQAACQIAADPDALVMSIAEAGKRSSVSTEVLRLMLPCAGAKVKAEGLVQLLNGHFTADQIQVLETSFAFEAPTLNESIAIAQTRAVIKLRQQVLGSYPKIAITIGDLRHWPKNKLPKEQVELIAEHLALDASESDFIEAMSWASSDNRSQLFRASLRPLILRSVPAVLSLFRCSNRAELADRVSISDPALIANAIKNHVPVRELLMFVIVNDQEMIEIFSMFHKWGVPEDAAAEFFIASSRKIYISARDVDFLSKSSLLPFQIENMFSSLNHEPLDLEPATVARLLSLGVHDEAILALGRDATGRAYRVGGDVSGPVIISKTEPTYSQEARNAKYSGTVLLSLVVDANGLPRDIKVYRPLGLGLDEKAIEAVYQWRFRAGMKNGHAVATEATITVSFRLL